MSAKRAGAVVAGKQAFKRGKALENRVARILRAEGRAGVRTNVTLVDSQGHRSEVDVMYGRWFKTYIECKNYSSRPVPLQDVAKFKAVLELNGIPPSRGMVVAPSGFTPRCRTIGIRCIGGKELDAWEAAAKGRARRVLAGQALLSLCLLGGAMVYQAPFLVEVWGLTGRQADQLLQAHKMLLEALSTVQQAWQR